MRQSLKPSGVALPGLVMQFMSRAKQHDGEGPRRRGQAAPSWEPSGVLERHRWLPIAILLLAPIVLQLPLWLLGASTDPLWFFSEVGRGNQTLPNLPVLDPNVGYTSEALGRLAALGWLHGVVPWWNSYSGIGMPLAGELQPGALFLPFSLLLALPQGLLWQRLAMQMVAGLATYALLRELRLSRLAGLVGGLLFAFNGTFAWTPGPASVYCSAPFLPMLLWGIERSRKPKMGAISVLAVGVAIAWSVLAGFPEPAYIGGLLALCWGVYRLVQTTERGAMLKRTLGGLLLGLLVAAPLLLAFVDYIASSDSFAVHKLAGLSLPAAAFPLTLMPYAFGPLADGAPSKLLTLIWNNIGGYTTALAFLVAMIGFSDRSRDRGLKILLLVWIAVTWLRDFGVQPVTAIVNHLPLLSHATFCRFSPPSWELAIAVLAAYGFDTLGAAAFSRRFAYSATLVLLAFSAVLAWPGRSAWGWNHGQTLLRMGFLAVALAWAAGSVLLAGYLWGRPPGQSRRAALACLLVFEAALAFLLPEASARRRNTLDTAALAFLQSHLGLSRVHSLGPLAPNYGAYFGIASVDHNVLPVPRLWADYVDKNLMSGLLQYSDGVIFSPNYQAYGPAADQRMLRDHLEQYEETGVRYVLTDPGQSPVEIHPGVAASALAAKQGSRTQRWAQGVLESPRSSGPARWLAKKIVQARSEPAAAAGPPSDPAEAANVSAAGASLPAAPSLPDAAQMGLVRVYADPLLDVWQLPRTAPYYEVTQGGPCLVTEAARESVTLVCQAPATVRRRELYMPGWRATENEGSAAPVEQDGIFQQVPVGPGRHVLRYAFVPPHMMWAVVACAFGLLGLLAQVGRLGIAGRRAGVTFPVGAGEGVAPGR